MIHVCLRGWEAKREGEDVLLAVNAGEPWDAFVRDSVANCWAGLECLSGIPGSVGATPIQNVGAYGQEVSDCIEWVDVLDLHSHQTARLGPGACGFGYRTSVFKTSQKDRYLVIAVGFRLKEDGRPTIVYRDLVQRVGAGADLAKVRRTVLAIRREKAMVVEPDEPNSRSCGSFFTNPILDIGAYRAFTKKYAGSHPSFSAGEGLIKIPAAWLIEQAGFKKGHVHKGVGLSEKHSLALINRGTGTANQILELATQIRKAVFGRFGLILDPEPVIASRSGARLTLPPVS